MGERIHMVIKCFLCFTTSRAHKAIQDFVGIGRKFMKAQAREVRPIDFVDIKMDEGRIGSTQNLSQLRMFAKVVYLGISAASIAQYPESVIHVVG